MVPSDGPVGEGGRLLPATYWRTSSSASVGTSSSMARFHAFASSSSFCEPSLPSKDSVRWSTCSSSGLSRRRAERRGV
eukprot:9942437-Prorocentrum_lima.AAC.1